MVSRVVLSAPATIANIGPGFDVFGLALAEPFDVVEARVSKSGIKITDITGVGAASLPRDPDLNTVGIAAAKAMELIGCERGLELKIKKGIKPGGGMGSSGAGAAAGAVAVNELFGGGLSKRELIEAAVVAEAAVAGSAHYDNVTPAIVGGFTIVLSIKPFEYRRLPPPKMKIVIAQPAIEVSTRKAREILPKEVPLHDVVAHIGRACAMVTLPDATYIDEFGKYMVDSIAEPAREHLIPGFLK